LLIKLLAEISEASIFAKPESLNDGEIVLIVIIACLLTAAHFYYWQRGMGLTRTSLFMPVYRLCFIVSGVIAALVFLREFFNQSAGAIVAYTLGLAMDVALLAYLTHNALNERSKDDFSTVMFAEDEDLDHVTEVISPFRFYFNLTPSPGAHHRSFSYGDSDDNSPHFTSTLRAPRYVARACGGGGPTPTSLLTSVSLISAFHP